MEKKILTINGIRQVVIHHPDAMLADVLRNQVHILGVKKGCGQGHCGACSVILNGKLTLSCIVKMDRVPDEATILTVEGIGAPGRLHPIQTSFKYHGVAQCGFCTPGFVISSFALLLENPKPSRQEIRDWFTKHHNVCRCNGYRPYVDAVMDAAAVLRGEKSLNEITYKEPANNKVWGTNRPRPSEEAKVTGTWDFGADLAAKLPSDTLQCALVQSEVPHANILSIDTSAAEKMPGVFKVVTAKDVKGRNQITGLITFPTNKGDGWDRPILCDKKVFQIGDAIAIVCADTKEQAEAAARYVKVELENLPAYMSAPEAMADDAIEIHPGTPNIYFEQKTVKGEEVAPLFEKAAYVAEGDYYLQRQPHLTVEPDNGFAYIDEEGCLTIHSKSIGIHLHAAMIAEGMGVAMDKLRLVQNNAGGTFGYKFSPTTEALVGVACLATRRPVVLIYNYYQHMTYTGKRSPMFLHCKLGADKDGKLIAMEGEWFVDHGPYSEFGDLLTLRVNQFMGGGYNIPNIRGIGHTVCTNHIWGAAFRGFGSPQAYLASESCIDELAEKMGMDPFDLRYKNIYRKGSTTPTGQTPDSFCFEKMMDTLKPNYEAAKAKAKKESTPEFQKGVGISLGVYGCGLDGVDSSEAFAELGPDGKVTIFSAWGEHGQGNDSGALGTAHETLRTAGFTVDQIKLIFNDMKYTPNSGPAGGSRSQTMVGNAIKIACENLLTEMRKSDGSYRTYDEMKIDGKNTKAVGKFAMSDAAGCDANGQGRPFMVYEYGLFMAEVTVETATGKTKVDKFTCYGDCGVVNNYLIVEGQILGGCTQGIGLALSEDIEDYKKHTTMRSAGIPYCDDIPDQWDIRFFENPREYGPNGAGGVGELPLTSPHVAVINAINNACGVRIRHLPAYPERVLEGLKALKK